MRQPTIAIVGSVDPTRSYTPPIRNAERAAELGHELGRRLAEAGMRIVVYSSNRQFIESYFVRGYLESGQAKKMSIEVRYPVDHDDYRLFPLYNKYPDCFHLCPDHHSSWEVSFYDSIHNVDGLVLLGGGSSTLVSGLLAITDRKPLISIADFGGSAETVWSLLNPNNHIATAEQIELMGRPWSSELAPALVKCLSGQVDRYAELKRELRIEQNIPKDKENGLRIVWLSDLHIAQESDEQPFIMRQVKNWWGGLRYVKGNPLTQHFPEANLTRILDRIGKLKPDHILVTGDLTNYAKENQFSKIRELFKHYQVLIKGGTLRDLDPELWTILPGNHDVTEANQVQGSERRNLGMFFANFKEVYPGSGPNYDGVFPLRKRLSKRAPDSINVILFGMDSTVKAPVSTVGFNARGRIDSAQLDELSRQLRNKAEGDVVLVALHHHPVVVPHIVHELEDYFLSLEENDGKRLVKLCANEGVSAILHGHYHKFSFWSLLAPQETRQMAVIGSPSGTTDIPGVNVEFLELREAWRESKWGPRNGVALYRHSYEDQAWKDEYIAFIE
jgi:3',5'-cyclic AMP phosphodiesterase CpdA